MLKRTVVAMALSALLVAAPAEAQNITAPPPPVPAGIKVDSVMVHSKAVEGNLEGNSADRNAMVVLPASYAKNPDTLTKLGGSMYSSSVTTGDFQRFVAKDLVAYIDSHYRTIAKREGRGLAGHSMGGYGTWVIGMRYPEMFNAIYAQSACCGSPFKDGKVDALVMAEWANNSPLAMIPSHVWELRSYKAIGSDVGTKDGLIKDDTAIHEMLDKQGVANTWATYDGTHDDHIAQRFDEVVLPFFAQNLAMK